MDNKNTNKNTEIGQQEGSITFSNINNNNNTRTIHDVPIASQQAQQAKQQAQITLLTTLQVSPRFNSSQKSYTSSGGIFGDDYNVISNNTDYLYDKMRHYNLRAEVVPPYVLDSIAKAQVSDKNQNGNISNNAEADLGTIPYGNDIFLSSIDNNWGKFIRTVGGKTSNLFSNQIIPTAKNKHDDKSNATQNNSNNNKNVINDTDNISNTPKNSSELYSNYGSKYDDDVRVPDLSGPWQGGDRLKKTLNDDVYQLNSPYKTSTLTRLKHFLGFPVDDENPFRKHDEFSPKIRSSAKYWMSTEQRGKWGTHFRDLMFYNPFVVVCLRSLMFIFCTIALALAVSIFKASNQSTTDMITQQPSTIMAICVQSFAMIYLIYVCFDEYKGKPLGLRDPMSKVRLILFDLIFIIFSAANLALAYNTLFDNRWVCRKSSNSKRENTLNIKIPKTCDEQRSLSAILFILLCAWVLAFSISIFRVVGRVSSPHD